MIGQNILIFSIPLCVHPLMLLMASLHLTEKQQHSGSSGATLSQTYSSEFGREHFNAELLKIFPIKLLNAQCNNILLYLHQRLHSQWPKLEGNLK
jgi:hypothetical protein